MLVRVSLTLAILYVYNSIVINTSPTSILVLASVKHESHFDSCDSIC